MEWALYTSEVACRSSYSLLYVFMYFAGTTWANEMNFSVIMPLAQDRSLDPLANSPGRYHCPMDALVLSSAALSDTGQR